MMRNALRLNGAEGAWTGQRSARNLRFSAAETRVRRNVGRYEFHRELFDQFWQVMLDLGRVPQIGEFDRLAEVKKAGGGINRLWP